ncbi:MAG: ribonuclease HIII [Thermoplasmatota archaeon]
MTTVVLSFPPGRAEELRSALASHDMKFEDAEHAFFRARRPGVVVTAFRSGKLTLAGEQAEEFAFVVEKTHGALGLGRTAGPSLARGPFVRRIGSDESGKGDVFGPLVVGAVRIDDAETEQALVAWGVRDSKSVTDAEIAELAPRIRKACSGDVVRIGPPRYNEMYAETPNLNRLLAWAHEKVDGELLAKPDSRSVAEVVVDRFATGALEGLRRKLPRGVALVEETKAESKYVAVAAASIIARAEFVAALTAMEAKWGVAFPKGAGAPVDRALDAFVERHGSDALAEVAKTHFANVARFRRSRS